jgi:hypothetical protein
VEKLIDIPTGESVGSQVSTKPEPTDLVVGARIKYKIEPLPD